MTKSVAIIGAGPAGIIAARKLLQSGQFDVTIFEKNNRIGGSWVPEGIINPIMRTNQSKFTMSFSDLSWESLGTLPIYPRASDVYRYLEEYVERYIPLEYIRFQTTVEAVEQRAGGSTDSCIRWELRLYEQTVDQAPRSYHDVFDYLVAAPGFYNIPKTPHLGSVTIPILHSTQYRSLDNIDNGLMSASADEQTILVVGGSHSGGDIAALIALQLSDARYTSKLSIVDPATWKHTGVVHISSHEIFALPAFIQDSRASSCSFQPVDFTLLNRANRPVDPPPVFTTSLVTPEKIKASRKMIHTIVDGDEGYDDTRKLDKLAPIGILGDTYPQFVETGRIVQIRGTLTHLEDVDRGDLVTATIQKANGGGSIALSNVCAVVYATGFDTPSSLDFLSQRVKTSLDHDPACPPAPFVLDTNFLSQNSSVPTLGIVGYPGAYWPLFEMQARAIVHAWTPLTQADHDCARERIEQRTKLREYYTTLRKAFNEGRKGEIPNSPFGDAIGVLEQAARELDLERFDLGFSEVEGFVCSARYTDSGSDKTEAMKTLMAVQKVRQEGQQGTFLARAVARGFMGQWVAAGKDSNGKIEVVQLSFLPRFPTDPAHTWEYVAERTEGNTTQHKVYRYSEVTERLTVWTVVGDSFGTGRVESTFQFKHDLQEHGKSTAMAVLVPTSNPGKDLDGMEVFQFQFSGSSLKTWTVSKASQSLNFIRVGQA